MSFKILLFCFTFLINNPSKGQSEDTCKLHFSSIKLESIVFPNFELTSYYFPIKDNFGEHVDFNEKLTKNQIYIQLAQSLPSYSFIIKNKEKVVLEITLFQQYLGSENTFTFKLCDLKNGQTREIRSNFSGDISMHRANELIELKLDPYARIMNLANIGSEIYFDGRGFNILDYETIKRDIIKQVEESL